METRKYCYKQNNFNIKDAPTAVAKPLTKAEAKKIVTKNMDKFSLMQKKLYAQHRFGIIVVLQAMDAAGKDSLINHVFSGITPTGFQVANFKQPSHDELSHDFLWRVNREIPAKGRIGIFNRSYYEDVLISRVHPEILLRGNLPNVRTVDDINEAFYGQRYSDIRNYEQYLSHNGYIILKFFLHVSKEEQKNRFISRIQDHNKNWKFSAADIRERKYWNQYQDAYQRAIDSTATVENPWYVIPADDKWTSRAIFSQILLERVSQLPLAFPDVTAEQEMDLEAALEELKKS